MPDVKLPDGTTLRFPDGMSQDQMRSAINKHLGQEDQTQSTIADAAKSVGSGIVRSVAGMADAPGAVLNWAGGKAFDALEAAGVSENVAKYGRKALRLGPMGGGDRASKAAEFLVPGSTTYEPQTTVGEYAQTVGEFLPGVVMPGGVLRNAAQAIGGGIASEAFGQATEGSSIEPAARVVGGLLGGGLTGMAAAPKPSSIAGVSDDIAAAAQTLRRYGINPTVGQVTGREGLMRAEGAMAPRAAQLGDLTEAVLKTAGIKARAATPGVLKQGRNQITNGMNDILSSVDVPVNMQLGQRIAQVSDDYFQATAGGAPMPALRRIADELMDAATSPQGATIPASTMRGWRTILGAKTTSKDEAVRDAAHALREIIDDATEGALQALGRADDIAKLQVFRNQYRNFLAIVDATTKGGREAARGVITPERISTATKRVMGKTPYATGGGTELSELARASEMVLGSLPTVGAGGVRTLPLGAVLGTSGAGAGIAASNPLLALGLGVGGLAAPAAGSAALRSRMLQTMMADPKAAAARQLPMLPGLLATE